MNVGSTFSGIGGIDLGLERAGHTVAWHCEIDPWLRRVLAFHWPGTPCYDDIRTVGIRESGGPEREGSTGAGGAAAEGAVGADGEGGRGTVDLLCGGFPCQDLSVAGRRAGLGGERSGLFFEFARVADAVVRPGGWILLENVPGLLSSNRGRDFAIIRATLAELGFHDLAYRILDSRYFGVPQRRRRIFVLARRASGRRAEQVLLEPEGGGGDFAAGREARARPAAVSALGTTRGGGHGLNAEKAAGGFLQPFGLGVDDPDDVSGTLGSLADGGFRTTDIDGAGAYIVGRALTAHPGGRYDGDTETFVIEHPEVASALTETAAHNGTSPRGDANDNLIVAETLTAGSHPESNMPGRRREDDVNLVAIHENQRGEVTTSETAGALKQGGGKPGQGYSAIAFDWTQDDAAPEDRDYSPPVRGSTGHQPPALHQPLVGVRRLTPVECERLQGFPDDWTAVDGKATPDSRRYAACGNAVTVNVAEWIGRRLAEFG